jgi:hypothetical protein
VIALWGSWFFRRRGTVIPGLQRGEVDVILFVLFPHSGDALWEFGICGKYSPVRQ